MVIGARGHARVCIEALTDNPHCFVVGCVAQNGSGAADLPVQILGSDEDFATIMTAVQATHLFVAIGDNAVRAYFADRCFELDIALDIAISSGAFVSPSATVGAGTFIAPGAVISACASVGTAVIVNTGASVDHDCVVENGAHLAPASVLAGDVRIGCHALIGMGARILPGISVGDRAIVGAGAVVTRNVAPDTIVVGVPAHVMHRRNQ